MPDSALDAIFKAYDVRGIYPDELDESIARRIGNAFVAFTGSARVLVGRDARPSSAPLVAAFTDGALVAGADVVDLGVASTDLCYFAAGSLDSPAAMFTASHNPAEYNGVKLCRAGALPIGQDTGLAEIKAMVAGGLIERAEDPGRSESRDLLPAFVAHVHSFVDLDALAPIRVVSDTANGVGGLIVPAVFSRLPFELTMLYGELDGTFPNHPADPTTVDNLKDLARAVVDGDAADVVGLEDRVERLGRRHGGHSRSQGRRQGRRGSSPSGREEARCYPPTPGIRSSIAAGRHPPGAPTPRAPPAPSAPRR